MRLRLRGQSGQSTVELVAMLPLLVSVALGVAQLLAAGVAHELAEHAAENGAIAVGDGEDPEAAVRAALPGWARERVRVTVKNREVRVRLRPVTVFPGAGTPLTSEARADAGPEAGEDATSSSPPDRIPARAIDGLGAVSAPTRDVPPRGRR